MIGVGLSIPEVAVRRQVAALDVATTAALAAMTVQPAAPRAALYDMLIKGLKADGVWAALDWLSLFAAHDAQAALVNLKNPAQVATVVGAGLTYTVDRGYKGNGVDSYLSSGVLDTAAGNNTQDSSHLGAWINIAASAVTGGIVGTDAAQLQVIRLTSGGLGLLSRVHQTTGGGGAGLPQLGSLIGSRTDAGNSYLYGNGAQIVASPVASAAPTANPFLFLRGNLGMTDARIAAGFFGGGLSAAQAAALHGRLSSYLTTIGGA
jgi:hypothetical protein